MDLAILYNLRAKNQQLKLNIDKVTAIRVTQIPLLGVPPL